MFNFLKRKKPEAKRARSNVYLLNAAQRDMLEAKRARSNVLYKRGFAANKQDNTTYDWLVSTEHIDAEIESAYKRIKNRARSLANDNQYVKKYLSLLEVNVVGPKGFKLQNQARDENGKLDTVANNIIEQEFATWSKKKNCTVEQNMSFRELCCSVLKNTARDGEVFIRKIKNYDNDYGFALKLYDADWVDFDYNRDLRNGSYIRFGIEFDKWDRPVAYHIRKNTNNMYGYQEYYTVPADEIIHFFLPYRPGQKRGISWLHAVMLSLRQLDKYIEAEFVASRLAASKMGFYTSSAGGEYQGDATDSDTGNPIAEVEPGIFEKLPEGWNLTAFDPQHPTTAFGDFLTAGLQGIASGLIVPYCSLSGDLEGVNYSSIRQGELEARDNYKIIQTSMVEHLLDMIYEEWLTMSMMRGKIRLPFSKFEKFNKPTWQTRGWHWVDPKKDLEAAILAIENNIESREQVAIERGYDLEEMMEQLKEEKQLIEKHGLKGGASVAAKPGPGRPPEPEEEETDESEEPAEEEQ